MAKKITAIFLAMTLLFSAFCIPSSAEDEYSDFEKGFYKVVDGLLDALVGGIANLIFEPHDWITDDEYKAENFYEGTGKFLTQPAEGAEWSIGYANASIQTGDELNGGHNVGGSLAIGDKFATKIYDDQKVRTVAVSDGRGISIFACIDSYGLSLPDVRGIREQFAKDARAQGLKIDSITISTLHQHSCVDTFGLNGNLVEALFTASFKNLLGIEMPSGQNPEFMENLYNVTVDSMFNAVNDMKTGSLYFGTTDITEFIRDKRDPQVFDPNFNRLRFVPDDGSEETWILNAPIHCVGLGAGGTEVSGDYPYYMEQYINETAGANVFYFLGAELAISSQYDVIRDLDLTEVKAKYGEEMAETALFGIELAKRACAISNDKEVAPILNVKMAEVRVPVTNSILKLAARGGLLLNQLVKTGFGQYDVVSEIGYLEFGTDLAISMIPGELAPEIAYGGVDKAEDTWTGEDWNYDSFVEMTDGKTVIVYGLANDQIGYILPSNEWHSYLTENEEIVSTGPKAGIVITEAFEDLVDSTK